MRRVMGLCRDYKAPLITTGVLSVAVLAVVLSVPLLTKHAIDDAIGHHDRSQLLVFGLAVVGISLVRGVCNFLRRNLSGVTSVRIETDLRGRLFAHLQGLPVSFHEQWESGQLLARATSDLTAIRNFLAYAVIYLGFVGALFVGVAAITIATDARLAVVTLALVIPFAVVAVRFVHGIEGVYTRSREAVGEVTSVVEESAAGIRILKAFGREDRAMRRLDEATAGLLSVNMEAVGLRAFSIPALAAISNLVVAVVLGVGGLEVIHHRLTVGGLVAFTGWLYSVIVPLRYVGWMLAMGQQAAASGQRVFEILDTQPTIADMADARPMPPIQGEVTFDRVSFTYPGATAPALVDVSLTVSPGETVALVGMSGSGKSTVAALLPRFIDPDRGRLLVDGIDIKTVSLPSLRGQIGVVFDEPVLFSASVRENIAFGTPDAAEDEVVRAAVAAGADTFIRALPDGYATRVGEQGFSLSGGQRQRLALARALLCRPRILVLDDPLSSVDVRTEAEIEANLRTLRHGRTTFLIAHRASTVSMADRVFLLEDGRVTATGTHSGLLASNPSYRRVLAAELELDELAAEGSH